MRERERAKEKEKYREMERRDSEWFDVFLVRINFRGHARYPSIESRSSRHGAGRISKKIKEPLAPWNKYVSVALSLSLSLSLSLCVRVFFSFFFRDRIYVSKEVGSRGNFMASFRLFFQHD